MSDIDLRAELDRTYGRLHEMEAENHRLRELLARATDEAAATTVRLELPCKENGGAFYLTCPGAGEEDRCIELLRPPLELFATVLGGKLGERRSVGPSNSGGPE